MSMDGLSKCLLIALCGGVCGGTPRVESSPVILMDGFLVDRLETSESVQPDTDEIPRRSLETLFRAPPESLSLDIQPSAPAHGAGGEVARRQRAAQLHFNERRWESALREYQQLMRLQPGHMPFVSRAALLALQLGQYSIADAYLLDLSRTAPLKADYLVAWGGVLIRLARYDEAGERLEEALALEQDNLMARYKQLMLDVVTDREINERFWLYRPVPELVLVAGWLAGDEHVLRQLMGETGYERMVQAAFGDVPAQSLMPLYRALREASQHLNAEEWEKADERLTEALVLGADRPFLHLEVTRCLLESGDEQGAVVRAQALMNRYGKAVELRYGYGYILVKAGEYASAVEVLSEVSSEFADQWHIRIALAYALAGASQMDAAWPIIEDMAEQFPDQFPVWMEGDTPYLDAIRSDPRYNQLSLPGLP